MDKIEKELSRRVEPLLKEHGFALRKTWHCFVRKQPYGFDGFAISHLTSFDTEPIHQIFGGFGVRHDRIEIPFNTLGFIYGDDAQRQTVTFTRAYPPHPYGHPDHRIRIGQSTFESDLDRAEQRVRQYFLEEGLPFYERFASLAEIEAIVNADPKVPPMDFGPYSSGYFWEMRAVRGLLLAKLLNPERYGELRQAYLEHTFGTQLSAERRIAVMERVDALSVS